MIERLPEPVTVRPRIWAVGISKLRDVYRDIVSEYDVVAQLRLIERGYDDASREFATAGTDRPDVIVAAGSNGHYLKARVDVPVVLVNATGFDVMHALSRARREGSRVALVMHAEVPIELLRFCQVFALDIQHASYVGAEDAEACVLDLRDRGVDVIVGPGLVTELAERHGIKSVFLYSRTSVRAAIDAALDLARATLRESARRRRLDQVMQNLRDGVMALTADGRIEALSGRMAQMLRVPPSGAFGRRLIDIAPEFAALIPLDNGEMEEVIHGVTYAIHRHVWGDPDRETGAIITFQESVARHRAERSVKNRPRQGNVSARYQLNDLIGESAAMHAVRTRASRYAQEDATVLISGESGTGKELVAQGIHHASPRHGSAFIALNCGAFPETLLESELFGYEEGAFTGARKGGRAGLMEAAQGGTLFLDEIGEMPRPLQSRLLRVLQEREVVRLGSVEPIPINVRVIAASHQPLRERIEAGQFRADLYYRLNVLNIVIPPLRERRSDLPRLAASLLMQSARLASVDAAEQTLQAVIPMLQAYDWPGNVRELQNVITRLALEWDASQGRDGATITPAMLSSVAPELTLKVSPASSDKPPHARSDQHAHESRYEARHESAREPAHEQTHEASTRPTLKSQAKRLEVDQIRATLLAFEGDRDQACRALGISKTTLWRRLNR